MTLRRPFAATIALLAAALGAGCEPGPPSGRGHGVLVIAVDALRADHVGALGYDRNTTPNLDRLAAEGAIFEQAFTPAPGLIPGHAAVLTGCDPFVSQRRPQIELELGERWLIPELLPRLAVELLAGGYRTAAFADSADLSPVLGFEQGFQEFQLFESADYWQDDRAGVRARTERFFTWLRQLERSESWFAYVHLNDLERVWSVPIEGRGDLFEPRPHMQWIPPVGHSEPVFFALPRSRWRGNNLTVGEYEVRYDGALQYVDGELGGLFERLRREGRFEDTTVAVVGTFGTQFGEAGLLLDHGMLSMADLHVPWILRPALGRGFELGPREQLASTIDLAPTLLELAGVPLPTGMHGVSQVGVLRGDLEPAREYAYASCGRLFGFAVIGERWVYELTHPATASHPSLARSWFGTDSPPNELREILYDRFEDPFPPLDLRMPKGAHFQEMGDAGKLWYGRYMELARRALHLDKLFFDPIEPEEAAELRALGLLGDDA